jgi:hypothetical protein
VLSRSRRLLILPLLLVGLLVAVAVGSGARDDTDPPAPPAPPRTARDYLIISGAELQALPTSGAPWDALLAVADGDLGKPNWAARDNTNAGRTVGAALVYARTNRPQYRAKVVDVLRDLPDARMRGADVLSLSRQLAGYVIAADLVDYRDPELLALLGDLRVRQLGGHGRWHSLAQTSEDTASNWGAWATASRLAASLFVNDSADVGKVARIFRGFTGDRSAHTFAKTEDFDPAWTCEANEWVPINPPSCGELSGALVEDISRSKSSTKADDVGRTYSWETLGGATMTAQLLALAGHPDVYDWDEQALLRAAKFLHRNGGYPPKFSVNQYIPWALERPYGEDLGPKQPAGFGRMFGFTDWLAVPTQR